VFLDVLGFTILIPLLPFFVKRFSAADVTAGALLTATALCATLSSPVWGALSDRYGRKRALLGSQLFSFAGYVMLAGAGSLPVLFASRAVEGLGGGNLGVANSYVADVTTPEQRPQALALGTAAFGAGFVLGPILGGALAHFGFVVPFAVAAALQVVNFVLTATLLPGSKNWRHRTLRYSELRAALTSAAVAGLLVQRFLYIFAFTYFFTTFGLFAARVLGAGPAAASALLAVAGVVGAATQIALVGPLVRRFGTHRVALGAFAAGVVAYAALGAVTSIAAFVAAIALWALGGSILRPTLDARLVAHVPEDGRGAVLGVGDALDNFSMILAPTLGAAIIGIAPRAIGVLPGLSLAAGFWLTLREPDISER
jgi:DHA1 family tetracycline resistance protein-like MFS transporter